MATGKAGAVQQIAQAERQRRALALRKAGASFRAIADANGCSVATAHEDVRVALADLAAETRVATEEYRALQLARLDALLVGVWRQATGGDLDAVREARQLIAEQSKLMGAYAQPDAPDLGALAEIVLRWNDGRTIIDVTPEVDHNATAPAQLAAAGSGAPGAVPGDLRGPALGEVEISWGVIPGDGGAAGPGVVGGAELPASLDGVAGAEDAG